MLKVKWWDGTTLFIMVPLKSRTNVIILRSKSCHVMINKFNFLLDLVRVNVESTIIPWAEDFVILILELPTLLVCSFNQFHILLDS